jgi:hypothetical protein
MRQMRQMGQDHVGDRQGDDTELSGPEPEPDEQLGFQL